MFVDGLHVNAEMVRLGLTPFWTKYGRGRYAEDFESAEAEARAAKKPEPVTAEPVTAGRP